MVKHCEAKMIIVRIKGSGNQIIPIIFLTFILLWGTECFGQNSNPCPIDADIWVLAGQSNMAGAGRTPDTLSNPNIMMLNMDNRWMIARNPLHRIFEATASAYEKDFIELLPDSMKEWNKAHAMFQQLAAMSKTNPVGGVGPGMYFAKHVYEQTGRPIALIPCALGGSTMAQWDPAKKSWGDSSLYGTMINRIKSVGSKIKGLVWSQGESEAMILKTKTYKEDFLNLIDSFRKDAGNQELPIIIVQIGKFNTKDTAMDKTWEEVREIQRNILNMRKNIYMVSAIDLPQDDCAHTSTDGQKRLGRRIAEMALTYVYNLPGHAKQITLESMKLCKNEKSGSDYLHLHYSGVCGHLMSMGYPSNFELRVGGKVKIEYVVSKVEIDPNDDAGLDVYLSGVPNVPAQLVCGSGTFPYMNITDSLDMPIPAFGPIDIPLK
jgi:sialate O-acetylesterase